MHNGISNLRAFGKCRLDLAKKCLWYDEDLILLPLKSLELLCLLVEQGGEIVTKDEIWQTVWNETFVEETNLTHNIYLLRKTFRDLGEHDPIETVPRRGYRFAGKFEDEASEFTVEKHTQTRTVIEVQGQPSVETATSGNRWIPTVRSLIVQNRIAVAITAALAILTTVFGFSVYQKSVRGSTIAGIRSVAVLPFNSIGEESQYRHQGLGLADVLITRLSNIKEIDVRPTSAVLAYENSIVDSVSAGTKLAVDAVLEGTINRTGKKVRVTARLIRVDDGSPIWAGQFEKPVTDEIRLQDEIALEVVDALALNLSGLDKKALTKRYTENADAYQLYQKGRYEWNRRNWASMVEAQRLFRNAIERDPNFALAHVGLADTLIMGSNFDEADIAIRRSLELDPDLAEAHASQGFYLTFHHWNWRDAELAFKRSIELNPNYATAHHWYAELLTIQGRHAEAKAEMRRALEIDPLSHNFLADLGQIYYFNGEYKEAEEYCLRALAIFPNFVFAHEYLHDIYLKTGEYDKAVEAEMNAEKVHSNFPNEPAERRAELEKSHLQTLSRYREGGIKNFEKGLIGETHDPSGAYLIAARYAFLGEKSKAIECLETAYRGKGFLAAFINADPVFDDLRADPRYLDILRRMGLNRVTDGGNGF